MVGTLNTVVAAVALLLLVQSPHHGAEGSPLLGVVYGAGQWSNPSFNYSSADSDAALANAAAMGLSHVRLLVTWFQQYENSTVVAPLSNPRSPLQTSSDEDVQHALAFADSLGLRVVLSPMLDLNWDILTNHRWVDDPTGHVSRTNIGATFTEAEWDAWFESYASFLQHYCHLMMTVDQGRMVDVFELGSNLDIVFAQEVRMRSLIANVRQWLKTAGHSVKITAGTNTPSNVAWWDAVDMIGKDAFDSLSASGAHNDSVAALSAAWRPYIRDLSVLSQRFGGKPVLITAFGYMSRPQCYTTPHNIPRPNPTDCSIWMFCVSLDCQAQAYEAFLSEFSTQAWFAGAFAWKMTSDPTEGGTSDSGFSPMGKPAEAVLRRFAPFEPQPSPLTVQEALHSRILRQRGQDHVATVRSVYPNKTNGFVFGGGQWTYPGAQFGTALSFQSIDMAADAGATALEFPVMWYVMHSNSTYMYPVTDDSPIRTATDDQLKAVLMYAQAKGLRVLLTPMLDPDCRFNPDPSKWWRGQIGQDFDEAQWDVFFANYTAFILHYAAIAQELAVDDFLITHELSAAVANAPAHHWQALITVVKTVYTGRLTAALNWAPFVSLQEVPVWASELSWVGIDCYFPLPVGDLWQPYDEPSLALLQRYWQLWVGEMAAYSQKLGGKMLMCTEVGYETRPNPFQNPAGTHERDGSDCSVWDQCFNMQSQALAYEALFTSLYPHDWYGGTFWWLWSSDPSQGGTTDDTFSMVGKSLTQAVLNKYW